MVASERRALAVMRGLGPQARGTTSRHGRARPVGRGGPRAGLISRAFGAGAGNGLWVGDVTCIDTDGAGSASRP